MTIDNYDTLWKIVACIFAYVESDTKNYKLWNMNNDDSDYKLVFVVIKHGNYFLTIPLAKSATLFYTGRNV